MKRFLPLFSLLILIFSEYSFAQNIQITGTIISSEDKQPLIGAIVLVKGTSNATATDLDGKFTLSVPPDATALIISYVGLKTQEVLLEGKKEFNITLLSEVKEVEQVVVTAIGIKRSEKTLGYASTQVSGDDINMSNTSSAMNALEGKVAGVQIESASGQPGASTNVVLRGYSSITESTQPLWVVDGSPINNESNADLSSNQFAKSVDFGNQANDINPEDIESMTILKGASATALYGSRAANGVIMVTTKSGKKGDKIDIVVNSSACFSTPLRLPTMQNEFGQGWYGMLDLTQNGSWGPKLDGKMQLWGNVVDNQQQYKPFAAQPNNLKDFFDIGQGYTNSIAISGGKDNSTFYLSYANDNENGIIPANVDQFIRNTVSLRGTLTGSRLKVSASANYVRKNSSAIATGQGNPQDGNTLYNNLLQIPRDFSIVDLQNYNNKFNNLDNYFTPYADNPYFILNQNRNLLTDNRFYGNLSLDLTITDWLSATWRLGGDISNSQLTSWVAIAKTDTLSINNIRGRTNVPGSVTDETIDRYQLNSDFLLKAKNKITPDITINSLIGFNSNERYLESLTSSVTGLNIPDFYNLSNSNNPIVSSTYLQQQRLFGVYASVDLSFKEYLFLSLTARNDWSSTLPPASNSFFYPGSTLSFIATDALPQLKKIFSYAKLRAGWGQTGNDAQPYQIRSIYDPGGINLSNGGSLIFPISGINAFQPGVDLGNLKLQPEITSEFEVGTNLRFFNNRLNLDLAYYDKTSNNQIIEVPVPTSSGYSEQVLNIAKLQNQGLEILVSMTPVKTESFTWTASYNFSENRNKVIALMPGTDSLTLLSSSDISYNAVVGQPLGVFKAPAVLTDPQGHIVVNSNGIPVTGPGTQVMGNVQPKYLMGFSSQFKYKAFTLGFSIDIREGGVIYSYTAQLNDFVGNSLRTTYNDRNPFVVPHSVQANTVGGSTNYVENYTPVNEENMASYYNPYYNSLRYRDLFLDRSYIKLREVTFSYDLPKKIVENVKLQGISVALIGRNLLLFTPKSNQFIDPEVTSFGQNDIFSEFGEMAAGPTIRSYSIAIKLKF